MNSESSEVPKVNKYFMNPNSLRLLMMIYSVGYLQRYSEDTGEDLFRLTEDGYVVKTDRAIFRATEKGSTLVKSLCDFANKD